MRLIINDIIEYQHEGLIKTGIFKWSNNYRIGLISLDGKQLEHDVDSIVIINIFDRDFRLPDLSLT